MFLKKLWNNIRLNEDLCDSLIFFISKSLARVVLELEITITKHKDIWINILPFLIIPSRWNYLHHVFMVSHVTLRKERAMYISCINDFTKTCDLSRFCFAFMVFAQ